MSRPIQISVWFPVVRRAGAQLTYGDYVGLASSETGGGNTESDRRIATHRFSHLLETNGVPAEASTRWMNSAMFASWERPVAAPTRAIVLIAHGNGQAAYSQAVLAEYLASRDFVVVTTPSPLRTGAALSSERDVYGVARLQATDLVLAAHEVARLGLGDSTRLAVVGHSFGARAGLLVLADAASSELISLDGGIGMSGGRDWLNDSPVTASQIRGRITHVYENNDTLLRPDFTLLRAMTSSQRTVILAPGLAHCQFTSFGTITPHFPKLAPGVIPPGTQTRAADVVRLTVCTLESWRARAPSMPCVRDARTLTIDTQWSSTSHP